MVATLMASIRIAERAFIALGMIIMSAMFFINVAVREFAPKLATELAWIDEATLFTLAWLVFVGLGLALERRRHIAMTVLEDRLPRPVTQAIRKVINLTGLLFCIFLVKVGFDLAYFIFQTGQISPTLGISMVVLYSSLPVGFALLGLRYLLELLGVQDRTGITTAVIE
ncbi:MAG: TRAP transporter small permease [Pseudolabrys sp.]